jgi:hypothetical protein
MKTMKENSFDGCDTANTDDGAPVDGTRVLVI